MTSPSTCRGLARVALALCLLVIPAARAFAGGAADRPAPVTTGRVQVGTALACPSCEDFDLCTLDSCDTATGTCRHDPRSCDDGNSCTADRCDASRGCVSTPVADRTACDDRNPCTQNDACFAGACMPGTTLPAGTSCDDGNPCTDSDACVQSFPHPGSNPVHCEGMFRPAGASCSDGNPCTGSDACDADHHCLGVPLSAGSACDDANACTLQDHCVAVEGTARCSGTPADCADGDLCTQDLCDAATGQCTHPPVDCRDGNACTTDVCDPATGQCRRDNVPGPCSDGTACTEQDACAGGNCVGQPATCTTFGTCDVAACDPWDGVCKHHDGVCPQGSECESAVCLNGQCINGNVPNGTHCGPPDPTHCSIGECLFGRCEPFPLVSCNDNNPCTQDLCGANQTCSSTPVPDGTDCGGSTGGFCRLHGTCRSGVCIDGPPLNCDDGAACTIDTCDPATGCVHTASCDDGNPCTRDSCSPGNDACVHEPLSGTLCGQDSCSSTYCQDGSCSGVEPRSCDDHNPCTTDRCQPGEGCVHNVACDDGNPCTTDGCLSDGSCVHPPAQEGTACNDGNPCTAFDSCKSTAGGAVCSGLPLTCFDGNPCTDDVTVTEGNTCVCDYPPIDSACCTNGTSLNCDDGNACTADRCDPAAGCVHDGPTQPSKEVCNGVDDDCDGLVDERETMPACAVRPIIMRDAGTLNVFSVTCRFAPACDPAAPSEVIGTVWLSAADALLDPADNRALPDPFAHCTDAIVENPTRRMISDGAVTFLFDPSGNGVCGTSHGGRAGLVAALAGVPDGKLARVCVKWRKAGLPDTERCGVVLVKHDASTEPQPLQGAPDDEDAGLLRPAP